MTAREQGDLVVAICIACGVLFILLPWLVGLVS